MEPIQALIIEDENNLRVIYRRVLEDLGITVIEAVNGQEALDLLEDLTPQLIFLDMLLPYVSGADLLPRITGDPRFKGTQVVVVSSNKQAGSLIRDYPDVYFVLKPIRLAQIRTLAEEILQKISS